MISGMCADVINAGESSACASMRSMQFLYCIVCMFRAKLKYLGTILKHASHCETVWLAIHGCVPRQISQWNSRRKVYVKADLNSYYVVEMSLHSVGNFVIIPTTFALRSPAIKTGQYTLNPVCNCGKIFIFLRYLIFE